MAEINVTPLVDVMLVLLIVFMITAPLLAAGLRVDLPQAKAALPLDPKEPVVLTVARDGTLTLGSDPVARDALAGAILAKLAGDSRAVHLRGDREVAYGEIVAVMDHLAANSITRIALMANSQGPAGPVAVAPPPASPSPAAPPPTAR
jgi:biopolymer transport protein ExbD/biopolymer transport protein TolR